MLTLSKALVALASEPTGGHSWFDLLRVAAIHSLLPRSSAKAPVDLLIIARSTSLRSQRGELGHGQTSRCK